MSAVCALKLLHLEYLLSNILKRTIKKSELNIGKRKEVIENQSNLLCKFVKTANFH